MTTPVMLLVNADSCTACRSCELACHYHHTGHFSANCSSIHIHYDGETSDLSITFDDTCDHCSEEKAPLCAQFCGPAAIQVQQ